MKECRRGWPRSTRGCWTMPPTSLPGCPANRRAAHPPLRAGATGRCPLPPGPARRRGGIGCDRGAVGPVRLPHGEQAGDERDDEQHGDSGEQRRAAVGSDGIRCVAAVRSLRPRRVRVAVLVSRKARSAGVRSGSAVACHRRLGRGGRRGRARCRDGPSSSQASAVRARWRRMRWPSTSSSSQSRRRGQALARDSWAISTVSSSLVTSRARTSSSTSRSCSASVATVRRGTRLRTGSPSGVGVTRRSSRSRSSGRCSSGTWP